MSGAAGDEQGPSTTGGMIAVVNLHAQIDGMAPTSVLLVDLLLLRGHVLGRIADYERATDLAAQLVRDTPGDGSAWLAQARTRAAFHRFTEALADLETAERTGLVRAAVVRDRAAILQAIGCHNQARDLHRSAAKHQRCFTTLGALAVFHAERGEVAEAERWAAWPGSTRPRALTRPPSTAFARWRPPVTTRSTPPSSPVLTGRHCPVRRGPAILGGRAGPSPRRRRPARPGWRTRARCQVRSRPGRARRRLRSPGPRVRRRAR
jgi:hypothetical protein